MKTTLELPLPHVSEGRFASVSVLTDETLFEKTGIRIAFTERTGGVSEGGYSSLNLANHVGDDAQAVAVNRALVCDALDIAVDRLIVPSQVHGDHLVLVSDAHESFNRACEEAFAGADAIVVEAADVAALLCYADCVPVIVVSPTGRFAVVHAGWRGVENEIAAQAVRTLSALDAKDGFAQTTECMNVYVGPYIHAECFETGDDVRELFSAKFGDRCTPDDTHVDLGCALRVSLTRAGVSPSRIADAGVCTVCNSDTFFSHRAQSGLAGRHGALAVRFEGGTVGS